jgi:putative transposase
MNLSTIEKKNLIERDNPCLSITRQCDLLSLSKGALYYEPVPIDPQTLVLMDLIDREYLRHPFYGGRKMTVYLKNAGHRVNVKRVRRLMRMMGLKAIYPKKRLSANIVIHPRYPYLLQDLVINHPDQVWCSDITYVRVGRGFVYLTVVLDWYSRYVLSWRLSTSLMADFCVEALDEALEKSLPKIFNVDQGPQYTCEDFLALLKRKHIQISMDSRGRYYDNIMVERLWRTVKYEEIYVKEYQTVREVIQALQAYFHFYNTERFHQSLNYKTPQEVYYCH